MAIEDVVAFAEEIRQIRVERDRYRAALERIDLQPDEIGLAADEASDEHQDCWRIAHAALYPAQSGTAGAE